MSSTLSPEQSPVIEEHAPVNARRRRRLLADCRQLLADRMAVVIHDALDKMSAELTAIAFEKVRADEQQTLLEAVSLVRVHREQIESRFRSVFLDVFERRLFSRADKTPAPQPGGELSLVGEDVVDGQIEFDRIVHRTRSKLDSDEVLGMRARLAELVERDWFEEARHPASPEAIFESLLQVFDELGTEASVKSALLEAFEPFVSANLNLVYSNVNERLKSNRILPVIRPQLQRSASADPRAAGHGGGLAPGAAQAPGATGLAGTDAGRGAERPVFPGAGLPRAAAAGVGQMPHAEPGLADAPAAVLIDDLVQRVAGGDAEARSSAARLLADPLQFGMADLPMPAVEDSLLDALSAVPVAAGAAVRVPGQVFAELGQHARQAGSSLDQLTVEIVSLVFDYIYSDQRLDDAVKQQLLRLQVVAVKAALLDRSFFARRQHPMRRLMDTITDLASDPDAECSEDSPLVAGITALIDWILASFDDDLGVFDEALQRLGALADAEEQRQAERLHKLTEQAAHEDALALAQEEARAELAQRLDESTPPFVRDFLYGWWTDVLAFARVDGNDPKEEFRQVLRLAEHLLWSVAPKEAEEIPRLASLLPQLIAGLARGLRVLDAPASESERFFNELLAWHTRAIEQAKQEARHEPGGALPERKRATVRLHADGQVEFRRPDIPQANAEPVPANSSLAAADSARASIIDSLERGCLLDFDEDGRSWRVKLAWVSPSRKLFALSRYPDFARSFSHAELVALFESGQLRMALEHSPLDRAIDSVVAMPAAQPESAFA